MAPLFDRFGLSQVLDGAGVTGLVIYFELARAVLARAVLGGTML
jgi:hypothetical protein